MTDISVERVRRKLLERSLRGQSKYGTTLAGAGLTRKQWLIHAQEEAMDLCNYLEMLLEAETE